MSQSELFTKLSEHAERTSGIEDRRAGKRGEEMADHA